jgi:phosphoglycerol transferase
VISIAQIRKFILKQQISTVAWLTSLAAVLLVYLSVRNAGLYPSVFADEWFYNLFSRLYDVKFSQRPSYLYFGIYSVTNRCGDGFLECARLINVLFFIAAIPLIYSLSRKYLSRNLALWITLLSVFSPVNVYSAYFMPESMYFFCFFLFAWIVIKGIYTKPYVAVILAGFTLGAMSMVKVHAVFLIIGFWVVIFLPLLKYFEYKNLIKAFCLALISLAAFLCFRLFVGYWIAGSEGVNILGADYAATAKSASGIEQLRQLMPLVAYNFWGNILALAVMFALPIALLMNINLSDLKSQNRLKSDLVVLKIFTCTQLIVLVFITAVFFARVQGTSPYENIARLSLRYYDFLFPLLFIIVGVSVQKIVDDSGKRYLKFIIIGGVAIVAIYAVWTRMVGYTPGIADSPELTAFTYDQCAYTVLGSLSVVCAVISLYRLRLGSVMYVWLFLPLTMVSSAYYINQEMRMRLVPDVYDEAGQFVDRYLGADVSKLAIIAPELSSIFRAHFYMKSQETTMVSLQNNSHITADVLHFGTEWLLLIGPYNNPFVENQLIHIPVKAAPYNLSKFNIAIPDQQVSYYTLLNVAPKFIIDFSKASFPPALRNVEGLSVAEPIGRWSVGNEVILTFQDKLPKRFDILIEASAFGPNIGKDVIIIVNGKRYFATFGEQISVVNISTSSEKSGDNLKILIPHPIAPSQLGFNADTRTLGIALKSIRIRELK